MEPAHLVGTGGALGAVARYTVGQFVTSDRFPFSTLAVNVVGSFALGLVVFAGLNSDVALLVGTGACGSFTTYSSFSVQAVRMWEEGERVRAGTYAFGTLGLCVVAAGLAAGLITVLQL